MISVLGRILLGEWELGAPSGGLPPPGIFTATWAPGTVPIGSAGGTLNDFTSVPGSLVLGRWELGQVPAESLAGLLVQVFEAAMLPDALLVEPPLFGTFTASLGPDAFLVGNLGALLFMAAMFPNAALLAIQHYDVGTFAWSAKPDAFLAGTLPNEFIASMFPDAAFVPLGSQGVDCTVGPNTPTALAAPNYVY